MTAFSIGEYAGHLERTLVLGAFTRALGDIWPVSGLLGICVRYLGSIDHPNSGGLRQKVQLLRDECFLGGRHLDSINFTQSSRLSRFLHFEHLDL